MRLVLALLIAALASTAIGAVALAQRGDGAGALVVELRDASGQVVGTARMAPGPGGTTDVVTRTGRGLRSGWHGFHVHAVGKCEGPGFMSAGGHVKAPGQGHKDHIGDLAPLLVKLNGAALSRITTDRFSVTDLQDADGSAVMVHAQPDNLGNIPPRYAPNGPDQTTVDTGDSGARVACGVIAPATR